MSKNKSAKTTVFTLNGFIKEKVAAAIGFHERTLPNMEWKSIGNLLQLKAQIAVGDLQTFLLGSKTDDELCGKRWLHLLSEIRTHKAFEPCATLPEKNWEPEYRKWFDKLVKLRVDADMAYHEMLYHRTGRQQYSWSRDEMSEHDIAELPAWWFDGTRAKSNLRKLHDA